MAISGKLVDQQFGPPVPVSPDDVGQIVLAVDTRDSAGRPSGKVEALGDAEFRRSIYVQVRRSMPLGLLEPFDLPQMTPNCEKRAASTAAPQSLFMMNNPFVIQQSEVLANRIRESAGTDLSAQVTLAWRLVFGRLPSESDVQAGVEFLTVPDATAETSSDALNLFCHALFSSNGFLYVD